MKGSIDGFRELMRNLLVAMEPMVAAADEAMAENGVRRIGDLQYGEISGYDMPTFMSLSPSALQELAFAGTGDDWHDLSPWYHVERGRSIPPFLAIYTDRRPDPKKQMILDYVARLSAAGVEASSYETAGKSHATLDSDIGRKDEPLNTVVLEFLTRHSTAG